LFNYKHVILLINFGVFEFELELVEEEIRVR
jgi:hypothetical protein